MLKYRVGEYGYIAAKDLKSAIDVVEIAPHFAAMYAQQAVEKIIKHYVRIAIDEPKESTMRTHKLKSLARDSGIVGLMSKIGDLSDLTDLYFNTRYPGEEYFDVKVDEAKEYLKLAVELFEIVEVAINKFEGNQLAEEQLELSRHDKILQCNEKQDK